MTSFEQLLEQLECELGLVLADPHRALLAQRSSAATREELLAQLTNGQTYFFRHPDQCDAFIDHLRHCDPGQTQQIWSAGCSTGCEAYSIAIMLDKARRSGQVLGTDVSRQRLAEAERALYRESRLNRLNSEERHRYFDLQPDGTWLVKPYLSSQVSFAHENLLRSDGPGMSRLWDAIFCRNVLIYFDEALAREVLGRVVARLKTGGVLVLGYPEAFFGLQHPELTLRTARSAIFKKVTTPTARSDSTSAPESTPPLRPLAGRPGPFQEGLRLHAMGRLEEARVCFRQAEEEAPGLPLVHYFSARLHDELRERRQAAACLRRYFETYREDDPEVLAFVARNGLTVDQLNLAAQRLRERLERSLA
jgi:chemotaxis protein methyltransferase CheR